MSPVSHLSRIELVCADPERSADFYETAFGFERIGGLPFAGSAFSRLIGIPDSLATAALFQLGAQNIALVDIRPQGKPYPTNVAGWNRLFQHIAIVVRDMDEAYGKLSTVSGWTAISIGGPEKLPSSSGGVQAFKFRDPEGHPLELIAFAPGAIPSVWQRASGNVFLGIDHSAISVVDSVRSTAFYESLGLHRSGGSLNIGQEQSRLDDIGDATVEVTSLALRQRPSPHVELLCYRGDFDQRPNVQGANDATATRLVFEAKDAREFGALCTLHHRALLGEPIRSVDGSLLALLGDPDGHLICLELAHAHVSQPPVANPG
jgi:catechol 2,3-dioxygenase-like lactoylglutathione lyase family enzyme